MLNKVENILPVAMRRVAMPGLTIDIIHGTFRVLYLWSNSEV